MLGNVFLKSLRDQRRALIGWSVGIVLLVLLEAALWPSIRDMPDLKEFLASYPEAIRKLFDLEDFGTGTGFMNVELFSSMLPILFIIFAVGRGARMIAGEEEAGTLDVLLLTPVTAVRLVLHQAAALAAVGAYVLYIAGELVTAVEPWQPLSPFHQALDGGPLGAGLPATYVLMPVAAAAALALAMPIFDRRDIAAH